MKVNPRVLDVTSTLEGEKIGMAIHEDALAHIMSVLTDLYADPELAVIREYSTNALDSHVEAFTDKPIEVTIPSQLSPFFKVRDFGLGLSLDDIRSIYSQYGASTKRESNDVVGMLGLGCKSALTYTDQFTLTGIKDGICTLVAVSRDEDGAGSMTIVDQYPTDEPCGVEIVVPAKQRNDFEFKANQFFRFWKPGSVLVNGTEPKHVDGLWIADDLLLSKEVDRDYVVMGNVAYPVPSDHRIHYRAPYVVAFVKIGEVQFTPSREALQLTKDTKETLARIKERVAKEKNPAFERLISEAPTKRDAITVFLESKNAGYDGKGIYKGVEIPSRLSLVPNIDTRVIGQVIPNEQRLTVVQKTKRYRQKGFSIENTHFVANWPRTAWIVNYDSVGFTPYKREKLEQWKATKQIPDYVEYFVLIAPSKVPVADWIDTSLVYNWKEIADQKIVREKVKTQNGRISGSFDAYVDGEYKYNMPASEIDATKPVFYAVKNDYNISAREVSIFNEACPAGYAIVYMGRNRINKFKRDFPTAKMASEYLREYATTWRDSLTKDQKIILLLNTSGKSREYLYLDPTRIEDPDLKHIVELAQNKDQTLIKKFEKLSRWVSSLGDAFFSDPLVKYPLMQHMGIYGKMSEAFNNDLYLYLNAAYAKEQN